jgi:hypothetical protein
MKVTLGTGALLALALVVAGCGGGGSSGNGGQPPLQALDQNTLVVQMDQNGDSELDLITLDISESPFVILECLHGMPGGDFEDVTPLLKGLAIDPALSGALATYVGDSFGEDRAELDVTNANGDPTKVVVFGIGGGDASGLAQSTMDVRPSCAAPGDAVRIKGGGFGEEPTVLFGDEQAEVLRSHENRLICRVPAGLGEGDVTIYVDGVEAGDFHVLAEGAPALVYVSTGTATPGMLVFFIGARLEGTTARFMDGETAKATAEVNGGSCVAYVKVPSDLEPGSYAMVLVNGAGDDTGPCSPVLNVVEPGDPTLESIEPSGQIPGRGVLCTGHDLGPLGFCFLTWAGSGGNDLFGFGFANGYDRVHTWVPGDATAGATYDVTIDFADGSSTANSLPYTVGTPPAPELTELEYDKGPPGSLVGIIGHGLVGGHYAWPTVHFTDENNVSTEALIYYAFGGYHGANNPGGGGQGDPGMPGGPNRLQGGGYGYDNGIDQVVVEVPRGLADGAYDVTVTLSDQTSNALVFTVGDLPLTVTSMKPNKQGPYGPMDVVVIRGTGFGVPDYDFVIADDNRGGPNGLAVFDPGTDPFENLFKVTVTWDGEGDPLEGYVLWHHDREILVFPPGGWEDPLPVGEYTVRVTVEHDDGGTETVEAGIYTVHEKSNDGGGFFPFPMNGVK